MLESTLTQWEPRYAARADRMRASEIRELLKIMDKPGIISFAGGIPDPALFPLKAVQEAYASVLADPALACASLQYSVSEGYLPLREWIVGHMASLGIACEPDNVVVTCGSQQGLEFLGRLLFSPGDTGLVTAPTYLGALQAFAAYEPRYDELRPEQGNRTPQSYRDAAKKAGGDVKLAYLVPDFANPTGETLSLAAREGMLDLCADLDIPLLEDTAYADLRFAGQPLPPILALDLKRSGHIDKTRTIYCGTFSKTMAPGLRIGFIVAGRPIVRRLVLIKQASDLNSATINQMVMHRLAASCFTSQVEAARAHYKRRASAMMAALETHMPSGGQWTRPQGGLFTWVTLPEGIEGAELLRRSVDEANVAFVPGAAFFFDGRGKNTIRLSYSLPTEEKIADGISRLAALVKSYCG